jgi:hypothetical protein
MRATAVVSIVVGLAFLLGTATPGWALPLFDGDIDQGGTDDYFYVLTDADDLPTDLKFGGADWNIKAALFDCDPVSDWLYIGLDVVGSFDRDGGGGAIPAITLVAFKTFDVSETYEFIFTTYNSFMVMSEPDGTPITTGWEAMIVNDLELRIKPADIVPDLDLDGFTFYARLDNLTGMPDDEITGSVVAPEPTTLGLLALGGLVLFVRRRRA